MIELGEWVADVGTRTSRVGGISQALRGAGLDWRWLGNAMRCGAALVRPAALTVGIALAAILVLASDGATLLLECSCAAIASGQWWRIATGHLTHWSADHLFWDLLMFGVLGAAVECRCRKRFVTLLAASALAISFAVLALQPQFVSYRGLSGVDSALFVAVCLSTLGEARKLDQHWRGTVAAAFIAAFAAKLAYEYGTGCTLFVASEASGFTPVPLAHLIGGITAVAVDFATCVSARGRCVPLIWRA